MDPDAAEEAAKEAARTVPPREHGGNHDIRTSPSARRCTSPSTSRGELRARRLPRLAGRRRITFCGAIEMAGYADVGVRLGQERHGGTRRRPPDLRARPPRPQLRGLHHVLRLLRDGGRRAALHRLAHRLPPGVSTGDRLPQKFGYTGQQALHILGTVPAEGVRAASSTSRTRARRWRCRRASSSSTSPGIWTTEPIAAILSSPTIPLSDRSGRPSDCRRGRSRPRQRARSEMAGARSGMTRASFRAERTRLRDARCAAIDVTRFDMAFTTEATEESSTEERSDDLLGPGKAIAATLGSTLGPNRLDKMVIDRSGSVVVTNTGATVLDGLEIDAPIGRVIRDAVQAHARHVGDGTTTTALLVGELLDAADTLAERGLHRPRSSTGTPARPRTPVTPSTSSASRSIRTTSGSARSRRRRLPDAGTRRRPGGSLISPLTRSARSTSTPPGSRFRRIPAAN